MSAPPKVSRELQDAVQDDALRAARDEAIRAALDKAEPPKSPAPDAAQE